MNQWREIDSLFQEALEQPAEKREAWLRKACGEDPALFREVASLLAHHKSGAFGHWPAGLAEQLLGGSPHFEPGQQLGPYEIVCFLAAGGMGAVYRAHDPRTGRDVAIKVVPDCRVWLRRK